MSSRQKKMVRWPSSRSRSPSPGRGAQSPQTASYRSPRSASPRSASPRTAAAYQRAATPSRFTPRTTSDLKTRESKVERRRLQSEAKAYKLSMQQQQHELRHMKRQQGLEYAVQHKEAYGITPATKYGIMAGVAGVIGFVLFQQI